MAKKGKPRKYADGALAYEKYLEKQREYTKDTMRKTVKRYAEKLGKNIERKKAQLAEIEELKKKIAKLEGK